MIRPTALVVAFAAGLVLAACPGRPPVAPGACTPITEDTDPASDHCSKSKADCEEVLSRTLRDAHANRCPAPPCSAYMAWVECAPTGDECGLADGSFGQRFTTAEHVRCR